jgi:hypothetical protein
MLPPAPNTSFCQFDNKSIDDGSNKNPNFKCIGQMEKRFKVDHKSPSADGMVCTPYPDYLKQNAWLQKVFLKMENLANQRMSKK